MLSFPPWLGPEISGPHRHSTSFAPTYKSQDPSQRGPRAFGRPGLIDILSTRCAIMHEHLCFLTCEARALDRVIR